MSFDPHDAAQIERYSRQLALRQIGPAGQAALGRSRVLVVGAGGLGGPASLYLAAAGVGTLGVADDDRVEASNLNRQVLFGVAQLGCEKVEAACTRLADLNPHVALKPLGRITAADARAIVREFDVVVDGSDNFATRFLLADACYFERVPLVHAGVVDAAGQVATFLPGGRPCYRCFLPAPPKRGLLPNCREAGVLGAACGTIGAIQAGEVIKIVTGAADRSLHGQMLIIDLWENRFDRVALPADPACPLCGEDPELTDVAAIADQPVGR